MADSQDSVGTVKLVLRITVDAMRATDLMGRINSTFDDDTEWQWDVAGNE